MFLLLVVLWDTPRSEVVWRVLATQSIRLIPFNFPAVRHSVPLHFTWNLTSIHFGYIFCACVCSLRYPACNAHASYCHLWSVWLCHFFPHYVINWTIFGKKKFNGHKMSPEESSRKWVCLNINLYREGLVELRPTPKLEDHPSLAVRDCLFNLFAATLLIGGRSSICNLRTRHAVVDGSPGGGMWVYGLDWAGPG